MQALDYTASELTTAPRRLLILCGKLTVLLVSWHNSNVSINASGTMRVCSKVTVNTVAAHSVCTEMVHGTKRFLNCSVFDSVSL